MHLKQRDEDAGRGDAGVVQRVDVADLAVGVAVAEVGAARLPIVEFGDRVRLAVALLGRHPALDVPHAYLARAHLAGARSHHAIGQLQRLHQRLGVLKQRLEPASRFVLVRPADHVLLYLVELMDTEQAAHVPPGRPGLAAEAGGDAGVAHGQLRCGENVTAVEIVKRHFACAGEIEIVVELVDVATAAGEMPGTDEGRFARERGQIDEREAAVFHEIRGEPPNRQLHLDHVSLQRERSRAGDLAGARYVGPVVQFEQLDVVARLEAKRGRLTPAPHLYVRVLVIADRLIGGRDVGHQQEQLVERFLLFAQARLQLLQRPSDLPAALDERLTFVLGRRRRLLGENVALVAQLLGLGQQALHLDVHR